MRVRVKFNGTNIEFLLLRHADFSSFYQVYVANSYKELLECIRENDTVIDAGANIGVFSVLAAKLVGPHGFVYAVEPDPETAAILKKNVEINNLKNVQVIERALWDRPGINLELIQEEARIKTAEDNGAQGKIITVTTTTFEDMLSELNAVPTVLKMDIEGAEKYALKKAKDVMKSVRCIEAEVHDYNSELMLKSFAGFNFYELLAERFSYVRDFIIKHPLLVLNLEAHNRFRTSYRVIKEKLKASTKGALPKTPYPKIIYGFKTIKI